MTTFIPSDAVATVPVSFVDALGRSVAAPSDVSFVSSTAGIDSISFDGANLTITPVADGSDSISVTELTGSLEITVGAPVAVGVVFGTPVFTAKS